MVQLSDFLEAFAVSGQAFSLAVYDHSPVNIVIDFDVFSHLFMHFSHSGPIGTGRGRYEDAATASPRAIPSSTAIIS